MNNTMLQPLTTDIRDLLADYGIRDEALTIDLAILVVEREKQAIVEMQ